MKNRIITISREFGSGGRTIGKQAAALLGIPCYDQELITRLARESGFSEAYVSEQSEYAPHGGVLANAFSERSFQGISNQDYLWITQRKIVLDLAARGPCVIVGRCADYVLRETADCLTVFIHAPLEWRAKRVVEVYGQNGATPEKRLREKDKRRAAYYQFYTGLEWGKAQNYQVALDSGALGIERCARLIARLYAQKPEG